MIRPDLILWAVVFVICLVAEIISLGLSTIWFAGGALIAFLIGLIGAPIWLQVLLFIVISALLLAFTRPIVVKHLNSKTVKTNVDSVVGQHGVVIENIDNYGALGLVDINGMEWSARAVNDYDQLVKGDKVVVQKIEGVKAFVIRA